MWKVLLLLSALSIAKLQGESCTTIAWSEAVKVTSTEVTVRWDCCARNAPTYRVDIESVADTRNCACNLTSLYNTTNRCSYTFSNLCPHANYQFTVTKYRGNDGYIVISDDIPQPISRTIYVQTKISAPGNTTIKEAKAINGTAVNLNWENACPNGRVQYNVTWSPGEGSFTTQDLELTVAQLQPVTTYTFVIHACNVLNSSMCSESSAVLVRTFPEAPSAPRDVKVVKTISGEYFLKWKRPLTTNGEIDGYYVKNLNDESEVILSGSILKHHLNDLIADTNYTFSVYAFNMDGKEQLDGTVANVNHTAKQEPAVVEMVNLMRKDMIREFSKTQAMIGKILRKLSGRK